MSTIFGEVLVPRMLLGLAALASPGCLTYKPYRYEPAGLRQPVPPEPSLRVAVLVADAGAFESRATEGSGAWLAAAAVLPGFWSISGGAQDRHDGGLASYRLENAKRRLKDQVAATELITFGLIEELESSGHFRDVHLDPVERDGYDLVIRPRLIANLGEENLTLYCFPMLVYVFFWYLGAPMGEVDREIEVRYELLTDRGVHEAESAARQWSYVTEWSYVTALWADDTQREHLLADQLAALNDQFLGGLLTRLAQEPAVPSATIGDEARMEDRRRILWLYNEATTLVRVVEHRVRVYKANLALMDLTGAQNRQISSIYGDLSGGLLQVLRLEELFESSGLTEQFIALFGSGLRTMLESEGELDSLESAGTVADVVRLLAAKDEELARVHREYIEGEADLEAALRKWEGGGDGGPDRGSGTTKLRVCISDYWIRTRELGLAEDLLTLGGPEYPEPDMTTSTDS